MEKQTMEGGERKLWLTFCRLHQLVLDGGEVEEFHFDVRCMHGEGMRVILLLLSDRGERVSDVSISSILSDLIRLVCSPLGLNLALPARDTLLQRDVLEPQGGELRGRSMLLLRWGLRC